MTKLRPFVPKYYGADMNASAGGKIDMTIENLLHGFDNGSYVDIKLGSSTLTMNSSMRKKLTRDFVDQDFTTSYSLGFTICGMNLKDPRTGNPRNGGKTGKSNPPKDIVEAQDYLERFFTNRNDYDYDALNFVIGELKEIL